MSWLQDSVLSRGQWPSTREPSYLFIDGGYLRESIAKLPGMLLTSDAPLLSLEPFSEAFTKVFYYDAPPVSESHPTPADVTADGAFKELMRSFNRTRGCHAFAGKTTGKRKRQKQVDVKLAVDMLSHTLHRNMKSATLLAGDQDFLPILEALKLAGMYTTLLYSPDSYSDALVDAADESACLTWGELHSFTDRDFQRKNSFPVFTGGSITGLQNQYGAQLVVVADLPAPAFAGKVAKHGTNYCIDLSATKFKTEYLMHPNLKVLCSCAANLFPEVFQFNQSQPGK